LVIADRHYLSIKVPIVSLPLEAIFVNTLVQKVTKSGQKGASLADGESRLPYSAEAVYNIKNKKGP
jgi:hypothetical protein